VLPAYTDRHVNVAPETILLTCLQFRGLLLLFSNLNYSLVGEYTAACHAGVFDERDALAIVVERGRPFESLAPGAMLSVMLDEASLIPLLGDSLSIAAVNTDALCVASGPVDDIAALEQVLMAQGVDCRRVPIDVAAHSIMLGPCRVVQAERPHVQVRSVDTRLQSHPRLVQSLAAASLAETVAPVTVEDAVIAWRAGERYASVLEPCRLACEGDDALHDQGVYLISGGVGGIGAMLAEHLLRRHSARVVFLGRSTVPEGEARAAWLQSHDPGDPISQRLIALDRLERLCGLVRSGGEVVTLPADVTDTEAVTAAMRRVKARFGRLDGVFHTAGVLDDTLLVQRNQAGAEGVLAPKVLGTLALDKGLQDVFGVEQPELFVLFSSTSTRLGLAGQATGDIDDVGRRIRSCAPSDLSP